MWIVILVSIQSLIITDYTSQELNLMTNRLRLNAIAFYILLFLAGISAANGAEDQHSFANPDQVSVAHLDLDLQVDFDRQTLGGWADLTLSYADPATTEILLDTRDLHIDRVEQLDGGAVVGTLVHTVGERDEVMGSRLTVTLDSDVGGIRIHYRTDPVASGLQWLTPEQTSNKRDPFLFTQSQAIHARSWIPLQDTPQVRQSYNATIRTPEHLLAVMSANNDPNTEKDGEYYFEMPQAIPSYLIALAVGDLQFKAIGARTGVYAEPYILDAAAEEFSATETMLETGEQLFGEYRWGRYDLLILPASFPFGGMENPRLSFITPTVIAGDKSLVSLIAHELAHSWSGNLVTNATWRDLWLNEGFTSYFENRIMDAIYGNRRAVMEQVLAVQDLQADLDSLPDEDQILTIDLQGRDPDDVFSQVPYVKGQLFLMRLEEIFGRAAIDEFLTGYFGNFEFESITTEQFMELLQSELLTGNSGSIADSELRQWIYEPGLPASLELPEIDAFRRIDGQRSSWLNGELTTANIPTAQWTVHEWIYFLRGLPDSLTAEHMRSLDEQFQFTSSGNNEIVHVWLLHAIRNDYVPANNRLEEYMVNIGRRKLIVPLYELLATTEQGRVKAAEIFERARPGYHPLAVGTVEAVLNP